ncbi:GntR family transcriptional regulator [Chelativorans sp.]|uniref:GntR family transcriptional regulator n=1 Tax=Chelativorans sp. TaxID=2203393 RepID=UPI002810CC4C|nr:GntR family transcriptional regulator [Chelativorans sp.]
MEKRANGKFARPPLSPNGEPRILDVEDLVREPQNEIAGIGRQRGSWLHLYDQVAQTVVGVTAFGSYRIVESAMAKHFNVSRTITNDVLLRLEERGLITRGPRGRWLVEQLSQQQLANIYQLRRTLEPVALIESAPELDKQFLQAARARIDSALGAEGQLTRKQANEIERDLHTTSLRHCRNGRLLGVIRNCQVLRIAQLYMPNQSASKEERTEYLGEHRLVIEALEKGAARLAAEALVFHLEASLRRASYRLELASQATPPEVPPFLVPADAE